MPIVAASSRVWPSKPWSEKNVTAASAMLFSLSAGERRRPRRASTGAVTVPALFAAKGVSKAEAEAADGRPTASPSNDSTLSNDKPYAVQREAQSANAAGPVHNL